MAGYKRQLEETGWSFEMHISFVEIYCEQLRDLLADQDTPFKPSDYKISKNEFGQCFVSNAEMVPVDPSDTHAIDELMQVLQGPVEAQGSGQDVMDGWV